MGSVLPIPEAPGPAPGDPGHFDHHDWLTDSVKALDVALDKTNQGMRIYTAIQAVPITASATASLDHNFPAGFFSANPVVQLTPVGSTAYLIASANTPNATRVNLNARHVDGTSFTTTVYVHIFAIGLGPLS
jgi:hypothetical protein